MDRLWAVKRDYDPFGSRILLPSLLYDFRCTTFTCPYCRWLFKITWGPFNSLLGCGERSCWHCRQLFWDGSNEWPEMSSEDRRLFLLPISIAGYLGALLVVSGLSFYGVLRKQPVKSPDFDILAILASPLVVWLVFRTLQVSRSIHRYNVRGTTDHS